MQLRMTAVLAMAATRLLVFGLLIGLVWSAPSSGDEAGVLTDIIDGLGQHSRPPNNGTSDPTTIGFEYYPVKLLYLNQAEQELAVAAVVFMMWADSRLTWIPADYGNTALVLVPLKKIWYPSVGQLRSTDAKYKLGTDGEEMVQIGAGGDVTWVNGGTYKSSCSLDVTYFPFDVQKCRQTFVPWPVVGTIRLDNSMLGMNTTARKSYYEINSEWDMTVVNVTAVTYDNGPYTMNEIYVDMTLTRKYQYYSQTVLFPSAMLAILVLIVFMLPADAGEKVSFGITVLLTFSVFQLTVSNALPKTSDSFPVVGVAILFLEMMSAFSILVSVMVLNIHHFGGVLGGPMSKYTRFFIFDVLALLTFKRGLIKRNFKAGHLTNPKKVQPNDEFFEKCEKLDKVVPKQWDRITQEKILDEVKKVTEKISDEEDHAKITLEWKLAAMIIDRFLMLLCTLAIIITFGVLFIPMFQYYQNNKA